MTTSTPHAIQCLPSITAGFSFTSILISNFVAAVIAGAIAWYVKGRGMSGVKIDLDNVKTDVENLKTKITPVA